MPSSYKRGAAPDERTFTDDNKGRRGTERACDRAGGAAASSEPDADPGDRILDAAFAGGGAAVLDRPGASTRLPGRHILRGGFP